VLHLRLSDCWAEERGIAGRFRVGEFEVICLVTDGALSSDHWLDWDAERVLFQIADRVMEQCDADILLRLRRLTVWPRGARGTDTEGAELFVELPVYPKPN